MLPPETPIPVARPWLPPFEDYEELARDIFERRWISNFAKYSDLLERRASEILGHEVLAVSSCDVGMTLAWRALGLGGGEVIVPSFTFVSTVNAIVWNGLTPVLVDIDAETLCVSPASVKEALSPATVGIAAVHMFGAPVSAEIDRIAADEELALLFDGAHAVGTTQRGRPLSGRGDATVFSLDGTKMVTAGEGGLAAFRDPDAAHRFRELRCHGFIGDYNAKGTGLNGKLSELPAALAFLSFAMIEEMVARRAEVAARYRHHLDGRHGIRMQPAPPPGDDRSYKDIVVIFPDATSRAAAEDRLSRHRVGTKRYFLPVHTMDAYRDVAIGTPLATTEAVWEQALCLPIYHDLTLEQVDYIADLVLGALTE